MEASRPDPRSRLEGRVVLLRALEDEDLPALFAAIGRPEVFAGGWGGGPAAYREDLGQWSGFIRRYLQWERGNVYAVCLRSDGDRVIGTTTLGDLDLPNASVHLGWTAYAPQVWGTAVNAEAKYLLLGVAFEHGFERVRLQADALNRRSRAAIERIGASPEGVLRHMNRRADGTWRDVAVYSVLREEWPRVRETLLRRLASSADPESRR